MKSIARFTYPRVVWRDGEKMLWNPIHRKPLKNRPEERVRLRTVEYLLAAGWSRNRISTEETVGSVGNSDLRTDVICYDRQFQRKLLIECKSEQIEISAQTALQTARYNQMVKAPYLMMTNGLNDYWYAIDGRKIRELEGPPDFLKDTARADDGAAAETTGKTYSDSSSDNPSETTDDNSGSAAGDTFGDTSGESSGTTPGDRLPGGNRSAWDAAVGPITRDYTFEQWQQYGFVGEKASSGLQDWLEPLLPGLWGDGKGDGILYLDFNRVYGDIPLDHYFRIEQLADKRRLALSTMGMAGGGTYLMAVLNEDGENTAVLTVNLDRLFSGADGSTLYTRAGVEIFNLSGRIDLTAADSARALYKELDKVL